MPEMMNLTETARHLGVSVPTITRLVADGRLPALRLADRVVRIRRADVEAYLEACRARSVVARKAA